MLTQDEMTEIKERMRKAGIPGVSIAYFDAQKAPALESVEHGVTDVHASNPGEPIVPETVFGAASLSKPVFSYLVLKLIADKQLLTAEGQAFDLDTPIYKILPIEVFYNDVLGEVVSLEFAEEAKKITSRMVLAHATGIPITGAPRFDFEPGTQYAYGNSALYYLQKALEKQMGRSLESLAQSAVFVPLGMAHSSFYPTYDLDLITESSSLRSPGTIYLNASVDGVHYEVTGQDDLLQRDAIPWEQLPLDFPRSISDISLLKKNHLLAILDRTGAANHTPSANHAANSLRTTARDYALFCAAWMQEKDCALVKMSVEPTTENQQASASSRYILTERGFFYYNKANARVQTVDLDETGFKLAALHRLFPGVLEEKPIGALSNEQIRQITIITGHTNPLQEAFTPTIPLTKDQWAIDRKVSEADRQHLAWGLGLGLQLDDAGEVISAFHSGDMNQWRGWAAMDVKTKSAVVYFANGNELKNGSGHGYGHVLAEVIVSSQVQLTHGLDGFFQKWGLARNVYEGWKEKEEADTAELDVYVRSRLETRTFRVTNTDRPNLYEVRGDYKLTETELAHGDRIVFIHTPPRSPIGDKPGILILMDGDQEIHPGEGGKSTPALLHELYKSQQIPPQVSVFIPPSPIGRVSEYACNRDFAQFLNSKLIPLLRRSPADGGFGCSRDRKKTTVGGASFGGLAAAHAALSHPETFGNVFAQSGAFWWDKEWMGFDHPQERWASASKDAALATTQRAMDMAWLLEIAQQEDLPVNFYLSGGEIEEANTPSLNDESYPGAVTLNESLHQRLTERGHSVITEITRGDHNYNSWQSDKPSALRALLCVPKPQLDVVDGESLGSAREMMQRYGRALDGVKQSKMATEEYSPPSPFQTTAKPKLPDE